MGIGIMWTSGAKKYIVFYTLIRMLSGVKQLYVYNFANEKFTVRDGIEMTHITKVQIRKI